MSIPIGKQLYYYRATVQNVYDGDTFRADVDLGMNVGVSWKGQSFRLAIVDTPEIQGEERADGVIVRDYVRSLMMGKDIIINTEQTGDYGRWLAWVFIPDSDILDEGESLNEHLLKIGYANYWGDTWTGLP